MKTASTDPTTHNLAGRAVRSSISVAASSYAGFVLSVLGTAGIARCVGPTDFGVYALGQAYAQIAVALGGFAFTQAVLQSDHDSPALADTALAMTLAVRLAVFLLAIPVSFVVLTGQGPAVAHVFLSLTAIQFLDAAKVGMAMPLRRRMEYGRTAAVTFVSAAVAHTSGVVAAKAGWGVNALVLRDALLSIVGVVVYLVCARRWRLPVGRHLDRSVAGEAWHFGSRVFVVRVIDQGLARLDRLIMGVLLPLDAIGCYQQARYVAGLPSAAVAPGNLSVAIGMYSRVRHDRERLSRAFDTVQFFVARLVPAFALVCAVWPDLVVSVMLGAKWSQATEALRVMGAVALLLPTIDSYRALMEASQQWRVLRWSSVTQSCVGVFALLALYRFGAVGASFALVVASAAALLLLVVASRHVVSSDFWRRYAPAIASTALALFVGYLLRRSLSTMALGAASLYLGALTTVIVYILGLAVLEARELQQRLLYILRAARRRAEPQGPSVD